MAVATEPAGLKDAFAAYEELLVAAGHSVNRSAVAGYLAEGDDAVGLLVQAFDSGVEDPALDGELDRALARMGELIAKLTDEVASVLLAEGDAPAKSDSASLAQFLAKAPETRRDCVADAILLNGHRQFLNPRSMPVSEFQEMLDERGDRQSLALCRLSRFLRDELAQRGIGAPVSRIRGWFDSGCGDESVPQCLRRIMSRVNGEFRAGLIGLDELTGGTDPDAWLEDVRCRLQFRSHSSMHKAIAEETGLKYDCVHKALSGRRKAKRVQAEIKYCIDGWLEDLQSGREVDIDEDHRGVSVAQMHALMPKLERRFSTKEGIYRLISRQTGIKTGSVRRYFQSNGQLKYAPLSVYRCAEALASGREDVSEAGHSYLSDVGTRRAADRLATRVRDALVRWRQAEDEDPELQLAFRELRRALIVTIKERRHATPVPA